MKIIFKKDDKSEISVAQVIDGQEKDFSYVDMIKNLIDSKLMEPAVISKGFSDDEKRSINSMVDHINAAVSQRSKPIKK